MKGFRWNDEKTTTIQLYHVSMESCDKRENKNNIDTQKMGSELNGVVGWKSRGEKVLFQFRYAGTRRVC